MSKKLGAFSINRMLHSVLRFGSIILVVLAIIILALLSFVTNLGIDPSIRNITTIALIALVLNFMIWDMFYKDQYNKVMSEDINNGAKNKYSVHVRYYKARKGFTQQQLRANIRKYNQNYINAWLEDIEDITGRKVNDTVIDTKTGLKEIGIRNGRYKGNSHKFLIWRVKHRKYPKSGIKTPRQLLNILSVGKSDAMKIHTNAENVHRNVGRVTKIITSFVGTFLAASIVYEFIEGTWESAIVKLIINITLIFASLFFGAVSGLKGAQMQLSVTEEICDLLEEWKNVPADIEKYGDIIIDDTDIKTEEKPVDDRCISIE